MFQRLIILEADRHSRWIKIIGLLLITVRFADWPYELIVHELSNNYVGSASIFQEGTCWAQWQIGVLILNFIGDAIANLFLSGMFVRRLYKHIRSTQSSTPQNQMIEYIARKSLVCLTLTFFVNLTMNLLKVTTFLDEYSDAFTVFFELAESTLLVEALRVDDQLKATVGCSQCGKSSGYGKSSSYNHGGQNPSQKRSRMPPFGSFDFVPLEERQSTPDPFRNNYSPSNSSQHHHHHHETSTSVSTMTGRRFPHNNDSDNEKDDPMQIQSSLDPPPRSATSATVNKSKSSMDITSGYAPSSTTTRGDNDGFMSSPVTFSRQKSISPTNNSTSPLAAAAAAAPQHQQQQIQDPPSDMSVPMDTLSSSLVHHPEWNNNDYRMF
ncbi:hypothetical protein BCR42DRAFT_222767 [Absidia repens]|uniref:Uncharacterized protein n=1 Tax=Absidia repens TaxID=90262 RepID=A0A1X2IQE6_9FUNG|nr:hypothetical protein BCR42DRAFT_222767 [Absidia repens]